MAVLSDGSGAVLHRAEAPAGPGAAAAFDADFFPTGHDVGYRPPPWDTRSRDGAITVSSAAPLLVVEGVGAGRKAFAPFLDALIWVQTDRVVATHRGLERDGGDAAFWDEWEARERPFLAADRPWERADLVVSGQDVRYDLVEVGRGVPDLPPELRRLER